MEDFLEEVRSVHDINKGRHTIPFEHLSLDYVRARLLGEIVEWFWTLQDRKDLRHPKVLESRELLDIAVMCYLVRKKILEVGRCEDVALQTLP